MLIGLTVRLARRFGWSQSVVDEVAKEGVGMGGVGRPAQLGVHHIGLSVTDLERSVAFYCDVLGAEVVFPIHEAHNFSGRRAALSLGGQILDVNEFAGNVGEVFDPTRTGLDHVGFTVASRDDLDSWAQWLDEHNVERSPIRDHDVDFPRVQWRAAMFDFLDPDGIQLEFIFMSRMELGTVTF
jgi:glyoxylase I family protein